MLVGKVCAMKSHVRLFSYQPLKDEIQGLSGENFECRTGRDVTKYQKTFCTMLH